MEIKEMKKAAFELANQKSTKDDENYKLYSPIYLAPTGNTKAVAKHYGYQENVLSVLGAGGFPLESVNNGAKKVDWFDCNGLQILFFDYLLNAIKYFDYKEFCKYFSTQNYNYKHVLSEDCFQKLRHLLSSETEEIFGTLYDYFYSTDLVMSDLFWCEHPIELEYLKKYVSYYNEESYKNIQRRLQNGECQITCQNLDLTASPKNYKEKYNLILLGNVLQYYKQIPKLNTFDQVNHFIQKELANCLTEDGVIQANYAFENATFAIQDTLGITDTDEQDILREMIVIQESIDGINIPLLQKYDGYSYTFIPGVETEGNYVSQNTIITYSRKRTHN